MVGKDKYIDHPVLGSVSCSGYYNAFKKCYEYLGDKKSASLQCYSYYDLGNYKPS